MRNKVRFHHKGGTKSPSLQTKTTRRAGQKAGPEKKSVAVVLFDYHTDETVSPGIDLTAAQFAAIQKDAAKRKESLDAWLMRTFDETPALRSLKTATPSPLASEIKENKSHAQPPEDKVYLNFVSENSGSSLAKVEVKSAQLADIQQIASLRGLSLDAFLNQLFLRMLNGVDFYTTELENAHYQSNTLLDLMAAAMMSECPPDWNGPAGAGLVSLISKTQSRLTAAFDQAAEVFSDLNIIPGGSKSANLALAGSIPSLAAAKGGAQ